MRGFVLLLTFSLTVLVPLTAAARETEHNLSAEEAKNSDLGQAKLFSVPFYMKGQEHPVVKKVLLEVMTEQPTRGAFRSDAAACERAFLSAIRELQESAMEKGGNAVTDIVSITGDKKTESATNYRCLAGDIVVRVGLKGTVVTLGE